MKNLFDSKQFKESINDHMTNERFRLNKNIGLRSFAKKAHVSTSTLSRVSNGKFPDVESFLRLCKWMEHSPESFMIKPYRPVNE